MAKIIVIIPAYNAEHTLGSTLDRIPRDSFGEIIVVDDCSKDDTSGVAKKYGVTVVRHEKNRGYGGAQKSAYAEALKRGADVAVMVHADGQYPPEKLPDIIKPILAGDADVVLASRALGGKMLEGGMPVLRYVGNKSLTFLENLVLGLDISEYHTGYRAYSRKFLESVPFALNSDRYEFDSDILIQAKLKGFKIAEIPIPTRYGDEVSYLNPVTYGFRILRVLSEYVLHVTHLHRYQKFN